MISKKLGIFVGLALLGAVLLQGCGGGGPDPTPAPIPAPTASPVVPTPAAAPAPTSTLETRDPGDQPVAQTEGYTEVSVTNGGTIQGVITFKGTPPPPGTITVTKDNDVFGDTIPDETMLVSAEGKVNWVAIFIVEINKGKPLPKALPLLTNKGGRFVPHVQVFSQREFVIRNSDPVLHNTHPYLGLKEEGGRSLYNVAMSTQGKEVRRPLKRGAGLHQIRCDAHDWMRGWVWLLDHPYGAVSGEDGTYVITDVPPGTYKLKAWHEKLGEQEVEVTVPAEGTAEINFEFSL